MTVNRSTSSNTCHCDDNPPHGMRPADPTHPANTSDPLCCLGNAMVDVLRADPHVGGFHVVLLEDDNSDDCHITFDFTYDHGTRSHQDDAKGDQAYVDSAKGDHADGDHADEDHTHGSGTRRGPHGPIGTVRELPPLADRPIRRPR